MEPLLSEKMDSASQSSRKHSRSTRSTLSSRASTSSSAARRKALAEAAAARQEAEYDRLLAEKERERIEMEAEEERKRQSQRARFECDKAVLTANKKLAIAEAKLKAIEQSIEDEDEKATIVTIPGLDNSIDTQEITQAWINAQGTMETLDCTGYPSLHHDSGKVSHSKLQSELTNARSCAKEEPLPSTNAASFEKSPPWKSVTGNTPLFGLRVTNPFASTPTDDLTTVNQRLVARLARQSLPKCQPEIFTGDVTLFHPWKSAFRAMIKDANVSPDQEINYLRSYTKGDAQKVVNNYRQRQYRNPVDALGDVWKELERRFGNTAAITNVLLVRLQTAAKFGEEDSDSLNWIFFQDSVA